MAKKLTSAQNKTWNNTFGYYKDKGYSDLKADKLTANDMTRIYPSLKKYKKWI